MSSTTTKHEQKTCPKCQSVFECRVGDPVRCQCSEVQLSDSTRDFLAKTHFDCLCKNCLASIEQKIQSLADEDFPESSELQEGRHYYYQNGFWVFTENYLILRGYCCRNGCRHCPYGFKKS
jgi:hypothetical protein